MKRAHIISMTKKAGYVSPIQVLDGYWKKPWSKLPEKQRQAWIEVLPGSNCEEKGVGEWWWNKFPPDQRPQLSEKFDHRNNPEREGERHIDWCDCSMDARTWFSMKDVAPENAAALLCQFNPLKCNCDPLDKNNDPKTVTNLETGPDDFKLLLAIFQDVARTDPMPRSLLQWLCVAVRAELSNELLRHHSWIDEYAGRLAYVLTGIGKLIEVEQIEFRLLELERKLLK